MDNVTALAVTVQGPGVKGLILPQRRRGAEKREREEKGD